MTIPGPCDMLPAPRSAWLHDGGSAPEPVLTEMTRDLLAKAGYDLRFRRDQWVECFASHGPERWRGRGHDEDDAVADVLRQMLPSALARGLFTAVINGGAETPPYPPASVLGTAVVGGGGGDCEPVLAVTVVEEEGPAIAPPIEEAPAFVAPVDEEVPALAAPVEEEAPALVAPVEEEAPARVAPVEEEAQALAPPAEEAVEEEAADLASATEEEAPVAVATSATAGGARATRILAAGATGRAVGSEAAPAFAVVLERGLFVVAGGRGASATGEVAAAMAVDAVRKAIEAEPPLSTSVKRLGMPLLVAAIEAANAEVFGAGRRDAALRRAGTTLAAALVVGRQAVLANVGDSRIFRLRRGALERLLPDTVPASRARTIGSNKSVEVVTWMVTVLPSDALVICTPGIHGLVTHDEIVATLARCPEAEAAASALVAGAAAREGQDDATAVVIRWES